MLYYYSMLLEQKEEQYTEDGSLKQSKKRGEPEKGRNNTATVSVAKNSMEYDIRLNQQASRL